jgi:GNAT superfamily N-acetyltransferase
MECRPVPGFRIRRVASKDIELLVQHRHMMFEEMVPSTEEELAVQDESYRIWVREMMERRLLHGYVVTSGRGRPAASGCIWLRQTQPSPGHPAGMVPYVLSVYTTPEFRRKGLASMIVTEAMEWGRRHGYHKIVLHASKTGRSVYSQLGWKRTWEMEYRFDGPEKPKARRAKPLPSTRRRTPAPPSRRG